MRMMLSRYAAGALALSAGVSVYTVSSLPRGGVARSWTKPQAAASARTAPAPSVFGPSRIMPAPAFVLDAPHEELQPRTLRPRGFAAPRASAPSLRAAGQPAPAPAVGATASLGEAAPVAASAGGPAAAAVFPRRNLPQPTRPREGERRPEMLGLIRAGDGADRVVGLASEGGYGLGAGSPGGTLQSFTWQEGPKVRDDLEER